MRRLVLGAGFAGSHVAETARQAGDDVVLSVRSDARARALRERGFEVTQAAVVDVARDLATRNTHVIICFPPDGETDAALAPLLREARAVSYISTTGVYGDTQGVIDDETPLPPNPTAAQARVLAAEARYRAVGAAILRAPGIYGRDRGLHIRVTSGIHKLPGDGNGYTSRIHAEDLARLLLASADEAARGKTYVVGDLEPARQRDVVEWICAEYACAFPPSVAAEDVHETLRRNRRVDASRALRELGVTLRYPDYRVGMRSSPAH